MADETTPGVIPAYRAHITRTEAQKRALALEVITYLNEVLAIDSEAISKLVFHRVTANEAMEAHPTTHVGVASLGAQKVYDLGMLGIINGLIGVADDGWGYVAAVCSLPGTVEYFTLGLGMFAPKGKPDAING